MNISQICPPHLSDVAHLGKSEKVILMYYLYNFLVIHVTFMYISV